MPSREAEQPTRLAVCRLSCFLTSSFQQDTPRIERASTLELTPSSPPRTVLEHFSCYCIAYPQWANQAEALLPVTWDKASVMAASRLSTVRALAERSCCLIFDHACSMGLKSGE